MKKMRLTDFVKKLAGEDENAVTKFEISILKKWSSAPLPVNGKPWESRRLLEMCPLQNLLNEEAITSVNFNITYDDKQFEVSTEDKIKNFRVVLKKYAICLHNQPLWGLTPQQLDTHINILKSYLLLCPFIIQTLDAQEFTVIMFIQDQQRFLSQIDVFQAKKRFLELLPFFEMEERVFCFSVLDKSFSLSSAAIDFSLKEILQITDYAIAFETSSPLHAINFLTEMGKVLAERNIDHEPLFSRLLSYVFLSRSDSDAIIPTLLFILADLRIELEEKAVLDIFPRMYNVRTIPELRKLICALIIFKKIVFKDNSRFSLQYECYLSHFLNAYQSALKQNRIVFCARDGLIGAYCRNFLVQSASHSSLVECAFNVGKLLEKADFKSDTYKSFSREQINILRFLRNIGLKVQSEVSTKLGTVDFYLPQLNLYIEHSGASHSLHFRPHLWSGYYVMRCNLLKKELENFYEISDVEDLINILRRFGWCNSLRTVQRARLLARIQHNDFVKKSQSLDKEEKLTLEEQLQFPIEDVAS